MMYKPKDLNMTIAIEWGLNFAPVGLLPTKIIPIEKRAKFILEIEEIFPAGYLPEMSYEEVQKKLIDLDTLVIKKKLYGENIKQYADLTQQDNNIGLCLLLWGGCMIASKAIARGTRSGLNTKRVRNRLSQSVEQYGIKHPFVAAGIDCAPVFKSLRKEPWSLEGIKWWNWLFQNNNNKSPHGK